MLPLNPNSLNTAQYSAPAYRVVEIPLNVDRQNGQFFPEIEGNIVYVESCDQPCSFSLVNNDDKQTVALRDGLKITGTFKGATLYHDKYVIVASNKPILRLIVSKLTDYENSLFRPITRYVANFVGPGVTAGANGSLNYTLQVPDKSRYIDRLKIYTRVTLAASFAGDCKLGVSYTDATGALVRPPQVTHKTLTLNNNFSANWFAGKVTVTSIDVLTYSLEIEVRDIPIPTGADRILISIAFSNASLSTVVDSELCVFTQ